MHKRITAPAVIAGAVMSISNGQIQIGFWDRCLPQPDLFAIRTKHGKQLELYPIANRRGRRPLCGRAALRRHRLAEDQSRPGDRPGCYRENRLRECDRHDLIDRDQCGLKRLRLNHR
jgi:hypothetical protein